MAMHPVASDFQALPAKYQDFYHDVCKVIPAQRLYADPVRTLAYGTDASFYRYIPKLVIKVHNLAEMQAALRAAYARDIPVTFRAAGTSLSGQAVTDSVLLVAAEGWGHYRVDADGATISLEPGILGSEANLYLRPHGRKIGPDPASINHALIGGIAANNASGMCCGTADNSYKTLAALKVVLADGTLLDTASEASRQAFRSSHSELLAELTALRQAALADAELAEWIRYKYKIKNTTGYGINALLDYEDPFDILSHLLIGSEGTLGFIAEITYHTVVDHAHKASALIIFPDMNEACQAVMRLDRTVVAAAELMDRTALRSVEGEAGMPTYLKTLPDGATSLLVEVRTETAAALETAIAAVNERLAGQTTLQPIQFTAVKEEYERLWHIRKGIFPAVGGMRPTGTSVIIEDVAFPREQLAEATLALRAVMDEYGYQDGIIYGHALDGNLHFVFAQDFNSEAEIARYRGLLESVCRMVVDTYRGSLKAEHGTGRNMAPFVAHEWGEPAYQLMQRIKQAFDPRGILNPDVILTDNPEIFMQQLKPMAAAHALVDKCIECGFCEINCPSRNLTATPRQRIVVQREIARLRQSGDSVARLQRLQDDYAYFGDETCATDGLCATTCPVGINTGDHTKHYRAQAMSSTGRTVGRLVARHFARVTSLAKLGLAGAHLAQTVLGNSLMGGLAGSLRRLSGNRLPQWTPWLPTPGETPQPSRQQAGVSAPKVVYFPSCVSRSMGGPARDDLDQRALTTAMLSLLEKAGYEVILPPDMDRLCCGMPFESKGLPETADALSRELESVLLACSHNGAYPVLCDTSPCLYRMRRVMDARLNLYEPVEFIHDFLLERLQFTPTAGTIAVHVTCSSTKLGLAAKFRKVAEHCAATVVMPEKVRCCGFAGDKGFEVPELNESALAELKDCLPPECEAGYSNSRTCEIGLSERSGLSYQSIVYLVDRSTAAKG